MDHVVCGHGCAVVELVIFAQVENPRGRILHLPALRQPSLEVAFTVVVGAERTRHFAPDSVEKRDAVAVWIGSLDGFSDAYRDARLSKTRAERKRREHDRGRRAAKPLGEASVHKILPKSVILLVSSALVTCQVQCDELRHLLVSSRAIVLQKLIA